MSTLSIVTQASTAFDKYDQIIVTKNAEGTAVTDILFSGFKVQLSDLVNQFPQTGGNTLTIYADTIVADVPEFNALGVVLIARVIDISSLYIGGTMQCWPIAVPPSNSIAPSVFEGLIMNSVNTGQPAALGFITSVTTGTNPTALFTLPTNQSNSQLQVGEFTVAGDGTLSSVSPGANAFLDLIDRPYALNSFYSSFYYATSLIDKGDDLSLSTAVNILTWICNCIGNAVPIPSSLTEMYSQASSLLLLISTPGDTHHLGALSADLYGTQITTLTQALEDYNTNLGQLNTESVSDQLITQISSAVSQTALMENAPTQTELSQVNSSIGSMYTSIQSLSQSLLLQTVTCKTNSQLLAVGINNAQINQFLENLVKMGVDLGAAIAQTVMAVKEDGKGAGQAIASIGTFCTQTATTISEMSTTYNQGDLITAAQTILTDTQTRLTAVFKSDQMWYEVNNPELATGITFNPVPLTGSPDLAWTNYMVQVNNVLSNLQATFQQNSLGGGVQQLANNYLASLQQLANYGKALNEQLSAFSGELCKGIALMARITAIKNINQVWNNLSAKAATSKEKVVGLQGLIEGRINSTMRSVYIAWQNYKNAYLYNNLTPPDEIITLNSSCGDITSAFTSASNWIAGLPVNGQGTTSLPSQNVQIQLNIPVIASPTPADYTNGSVFATVTSNGASGGGVISFKIPKVLNQFSKQIGSGDVSIWITGATFFVTGIVPNSNGYVPMEIGTSGLYVDGYSQSPLNFSSNPLSTHFSYKPANGNAPPQIIVPLQINAAVYMLPTPFTTWSLNIDAGCDLSSVTGVEITLTANVSFSE